MSAKPLLRLFTAALGLAGLLIHGAARAGIPDVPSPANSTIPSGIVLTGETSFGAPDPYGEFCVTVRGLYGFPLQGRLVVIDFSGSPVRLSANQSDPAIQWAQCSSASFGKFTAADGTVCFRLAGLPTTPGSSPAVTKANVYADGVLLGSPHLATLDLDATGGATASDLGAWLTQYFGGATNGLADFDGNGSLGAGDLSAWLQLYFHHGSTASAAAPLCP